MTLLVIAIAVAYTRRLAVKQPIRLAGVTPTKWPDAGLGCPMPDMAYAQVETAGYVIEFEHSDESSTYHTDMNRVVRCDQ